MVLRPHMKTAKSIDVARHVFPREPGPITVSTIAEAEYFAGHGFRDMTYAVGMSPASAIRAMELCRRTGVDLKLLLDYCGAGRCLGPRARGHWRDTIRLHRTGLR